MGLWRERGCSIVGKRCDYRAKESHWRIPIWALSIGTKVQKNSTTIAKGSQCYLAKKLWSFPREAQHPEKRKTKKQTQRVWSLQWRRQAARRRLCMDSKGSEAPSMKLERERGSEQRWLVWWCGGDVKRGSLFLGKADSVDCESSYNLIMFTVMILRMHLMLNCECKHPPRWSYTVGCYKNTNPRSLRMILQWQIREELALIHSQTGCQHK